MPTTNLRGDRRDGLIGQLDFEWDKAIADRHHAFGDLGFRRAGDLVDEISSHTSTTDRDAVVLELLTLGQQGDSLAERVLLQAMLPKVISLSRRSAGLRRLPRNEARTTAVTAMWEAIRTYPLHRTTSVLGNLGLNALSIVTKGFGAGHTGDVAELTAANEDMLAVLDADSTTHGADPAVGNDDPFSDLVKVLSWAVESNALTRDEVRILARAELGDAPDRDDLASELGIARDSLNRRVWRIRTKLMKAVQEFILTNGSW